MENTINVGSVVELKSGSPKMTVVDIHNQIAYCTWYDFNTNTWREEQTFPIVALDLA